MIKQKKENVGYILEESSDKILPNLFFRKIVFVYLDKIPLRILEHAIFTPHKNITLNLFYLSKMCSH